MKLFALVDCNNFFASCERVFQPSLINKPIVVLSNNDGCIVARSNEAKALGIPMGAPFYQIKDLIQNRGVSVFSSNFQLYGDMSERIMNSLRSFAPDLEVYSIDEAFLHLNPEERLYDKALEMRTKLLQWTGIPTSFGIAPTKTLAKIANRFAKKNTTEGVFQLTCPTLTDEILKKLPIQEIWGISSGFGRRLHKLGIFSALELKNADPKRIRKSLGVVGERIVYELCGNSCLGLEEVTPKKNILSSRSFGTPLTELKPIEEALANYAVRAAQKLRNQKSKAQGVYVFLNTNRFRKDEPYYANGATLGFDLPTSDTRLIIHYGKKLLQWIYRKGYNYHKCGIMLLDLIHEEIEQENLFVKRDSSKGDRLMKTVDQINRSMGSKTLFYAAQGIERKWKMRCNLSSPLYTTSWNDLPKVI